MNLRVRAGLSNFFSRWSKVAEPVALTCHRVTGALNWLCNLSEAKLGRVVQVVEPHVVGMLMSILGSTWGCVNSSSRNVYCRTEYNGILTRVDRSSRRVK